MEQTENLHAQDEEARKQITSAVHRLSYIYINAYKYMYNMPTNDPPYLFTNPL